MRIPFNRPFTTGKEFEYISQACQSGFISGDGPFTQKCQEWLRTKCKTTQALLTTSGTAGLEMAAILANIAPGDEVILPSFTFVSTANAFVLRGAVPVFIDIREDDLNMDERLIEKAITDRTRVIVPVHYAGVACEMDRIMEIANSRHLLVVEDAAQGVCSSYKGKALGSIGHLGALSFHETKVLISGEGGALLVNDPSMISRAEIIWQKGTNRKQFMQGMVDKYTWVDVGSSFLPSDLIAAFLFSQLESSEDIIGRQMKIWNRYHAAFEPLEKKGLCVRPRISTGQIHNAHIYYLIIEGKKRPSFLSRMQNRGIGAIFHYVPLHSSPAGKRLGRTGSSMDVTNRLSEGLVRLPMWAGLSTEDQDEVIQAVYEELK